MALRYIQCKTYATSSARDALRLVQNLRYMRAFAAVWPESQKVQQVVALFGVEAQAFPLGKRKGPAWNTEHSRETLI